LGHHLLRQPCYMPETVKRGTNQQDGETP